VYARFLSGGNLSPLVLSSGQMIAGAVLLTLLAPVVAREPATLTANVVTSVVVLGVLGTGIAYVLNYRLIADQGAIAASTVTYLLPIVAVLLGLVVLGERASWNLALGGRDHLGGRRFVRRPPAYEPADPAFEASRRIRACALRHNPSRQQTRDAHAASRFPTAHHRQQQRVNGESL